MFHERKSRCWEAYVAEERIEDAKKSLTSMGKQPSYFLLGNIKEVKSGKRYSRALFIFSLSQRSSVLPTVFEESSPIPFGGKPSRPVLREIIGDICEPGVIALFGTCPVGYDTNWYLSRVVNFKPSAMNKLNE